jgi:hypothetical protein
MRAAKHWKIIGLLLLVFFAGSVTGGVGTYLFTKRALEAAFDFDRWPDRGVRILDERMRLTPEQKVRVRVVQERLAGEMKEHFRQSMAESGRILLSGAAEIDEELTDEQRLIHAEMKRELRAGFRQHFQIELPEDGDSREGIDL